MATNEPIMASVAGRYASALFELASEQNAVAEIERDLTNFQSLLDESDDLNRLLESPVLSTEEQGDAIAAVVAKMDASQTTQNFFKLITQNRRLHVAGDVVRAFRALASKARGEVAAEVISASELTDEQVASLKATLKESVGKDVQLTANVDPSLLGGLVVKIGSRMVDSSLRTKLANMKAALTSSA